MTSKSKHVPVPDAEVRLQHIWRRVADRLDTRPRRRVWLAPALVGAIAASAVAVAVFLYWSGSRSNGSAWERATLQTASDSLDFALHDGSHIELFEQTRLALAEAETTAVEIALERGRVQCDVVPNPARRFVVHAGEVDVRVTGTRFSVERQGEHVSVTVQRGSVEVQRHDQGAPLARLSVGESWSIDTGATHAQAAPPDAPVVTSQPAESVAAAEPVAPAETAAVEPADDPAVAAPDQHPSPSAAARAPAASESSVTSVELSAKDLLERANQSRRDGDVRAAARDYERLLEQFPGDGRAGLSAFELGRLRMDRLGDLPGAVQALKRAVQLAPGSGFREDAMARLATAYGRLGQAAACAQARDRYLGAYPNGVHAQTVTRACGHAE